MRMTFEEGYGPYRKTLEKSFADVMRWKWQGFQTRYPEKDWEIKDSGTFRAMLDAIADLISECQKAPPGISAEESKLIKNLLDHTLLPARGKIGALLYSRGLLH